MLEINRGDTKTFTITVIDEKGDIYQLQENDRLIFKMMSNDEVIFEKEINDGVLEFQHEDTCEMSVGLYVFCIKLIFSNGDITTVADDKIIKIKR